MMFLCNKVHNVLCMFTKLSTASISRAASTYEGDGKTMAQVLNKDVDNIMVNSFSKIGFCLNNGVRLIGPVILFPRSFLSWNISGIMDVNEESLSLFSILCPKLDILVFGFGDSYSLPREVEFRVREFSKKRKIGIELLSTENAVATFNYLSYEGRYVAGAFLPPKDVKVYNDRDFLSMKVRQRLLEGD